MYNLLLGHSTASGNL